jgi:hypothetical protein
MGGIVLTFSVAAYEEFKIVTMHNELPKEPKPDTKNYPNYRQT